MTDISAVLAPIREEMAQLDELIAASLQSESGLVAKLSKHITDGGKRLRPALALLTTQACAYQGKQHVKLAAAIEFIHTATLLHDDVVDHATKRRGKQAAPEIWGNTASVLTGDFIYSRAFQMLCEIDECPQLAVLMSQATNVIAEGEILQMTNLGRDEVSELECIKIAEKKTAKLFEAACRAGAVLSSSKPELVDDLALFGLNFGIAFQLMDDLLDYAAGTGKSRGQDLAGGNPTLPFVHAVHNGTAADKKQLKSLLGSDKISEAYALLDAAGSFEYVRQKARSYADNCGTHLKNLPPSPHQEALASLSQFVTERKW